ncbi:hypothetical protein FB451DRAFT_1191310 [Mycena latifolia]|nr:hypothetical protein FB451DRAFT_1191310 [Mycena latifolia]
MCGGIDLQIFVRYRGLKFRAHTTKGENKGNMDCKFKAGEVVPRKLTLDTARDFLTCRGIQDALLDQRANRNTTLEDHLREVETPRSWGGGEGRWRARDLKNERRRSVSRFGVEAWSKGGFQQRIWRSGRAQPGSTTSTKHTRGGFGMHHPCDSGQKEFGRFARVEGGGGGEKMIQVNVLADEPTRVSVNGAGVGRHERYKRKSRQAPRPLSLERAYACRSGGRYLSDTNREDTI